MIMTGEGFMCTSPGSVFGPLSDVQMQKVESQYPFIAGTVFTSECRLQISLWSVKAEKANISD